MNASIREALFVRVAEARAHAERAVTDAQATTDSVRSVRATASTARRRRWTIRYERAFVKNSGLLSELDRPGD